MYGTGRCLLTSPKKDISTRSNGFCCSKSFKVSLEWVKNSKYFLRHVYIATFALPHLLHSHVCGKEKILLSMGYETYRNNLLGYPLRRQHKQDSPFHFCPAWNGKITRLTKSQKDETEKLLSQCPRFSIFFQRTCAIHSITKV